MNDISNRSLKDTCRDAKIMALLSSKKTGYSYEAYNEKATLSLFHRKRYKIRSRFIKAPLPWTI